MIDFIRRARQFCGPVEQRHCLYGADADLVLLALANRERNIVILREVRRREARSGEVVVEEVSVVIRVCLMGGRREEGGGRREEGGGRREEGGGRNEEGGE